MSTIAHTDRDRAVRLVAQVAGLSEQFLLRSNRPEVVSWRRAMFAAFRRAGYTLSQIGAAFSHRHHSTVLHSCRIAEKNDPALVEVIVRLLELASANAVVGHDVLAQAVIDTGDRPFDRAVARSNRAMSEIRLQAAQAQDAADKETLRLHAGSLILSGVAILKSLGRSKDVAGYLKEGTL